MSSTRKPSSPTSCFGFLQWQHFQYPSNLWNAFLRWEQQGAQHGSVLVTAFQKKAEVHPPAFEKFSTFLKSSMTSCWRKPKTSSGESQPGSSKIKAGSPSVRAAPLPFQYYFCCDLHGHRAEGLGDHTRHPLPGHLFCSKPCLRAATCTTALGGDFGAVGVRLASKIQLSCEYWYFLKLILQIFAFCLRVGKRGEETSQGKCVILQVALWSLDLFLFCCIDHPGNDISEQTCMHCLPIFLPHSALYCCTSACKKQPGIDRNLLWNFLHFLQEQTQSSVTANACALPRFQDAWPFFSKVPESYGSCH